MHLIAEEGPFRGLVISFTEGEEWILGRDPDMCDFVLEDSTVSRKHALCFRSPDGLCIKDLSTTNPILVNDQNIGESHLLREGDRIQLGQSVFLFSEEEPFIAETPSEELKEEEFLPEELKEEKTSHKKVPSEELAEEIFREELPQEELPEEKPALEEKAESEDYDTIFQEEVEGEFPFGLTGESNFILKVISGPNSGAEFGMEKGRSYLIGKDPNVCDIVFNDLSVSRQHATVHINEDGEISIEDMGSKNGTIVNSTTITEKSVITQQDLISLGTTSFLVIDKAKATETIYSPLPQAVMAPLPAEEAKEEKPPVNWKKQIIPMKYLVMAGAVLIALFSVFLSFFSLLKSENLAIVEKKPIEKIEDSLKRFEDLHFSFNPGSNTLFLTGHVLTNITQQELNYEIAQLNFIEKVESSVVVDEYVWKNMNDVLNERSDWKGVSVHSPKAGKFVVNGYVKTLQDGQNLSNYLNVNFPYLDRLESRVVIEDVLSAQIASLFLKGGFDGVNFQFSNGELIITGRFIDKNSKNFFSLIDGIKKMPGVRSINNLALSTSEENARIDLTTKYKITGYAEHENKKISIVANGQIVTLGDFLDGMEVVSILPSVILLEKEGIKYKINYSR